MDNLKNEFKEAMNQIMQEESFFTNREKQRVLHAIKGTSPQVRTPQRFILPKALTSLLTICFIALIGGLAANYLGIINPNNHAIHKEELKEFYPGIEYGDIINGWRLINKGPNDGAKPNHSGLLEAVFIGEAEITGALIYKPENEKNPGILYFKPNKEEAESLPLMKEKMKLLRFNFADQEMIKKIFGIAGSVSLDDITIKINKYTAQYRENEEIEDLVTLDHVVLPEDDVISAVPFALSLDNRNNIELSPELQNVYIEFSITRDERILADLSPADIFQLFYYSEEQKKSDVQYALYIQDEDYINPFGTLEEYLKAKQDPISEVNTEKFIVELKSLPLQEIIIDDENAFIQIGDESGFKIIKNKTGIWKVSWLPLQ